MIRPALTSEPERPGQRFLRAFRQIIESVNQTLKAQLDLERHGGLQAKIWCHIYAGRPWDAGEVDEAAQLRASVDNPRGQAITAAAVGLAQLIDGDTNAVDTLREAGRLAKERGLSTVDGAYQAFARIAEARGSPEGELLGLLELVHAFNRSHLPFTLRGNLRTFIPTLAALERRFAVGVLDGASTVATIFPRETAQAIQAARRRLGTAGYEAAVVAGERMSHDELVAFINTELETFDVTKKPSA